jgi:putative inorganic carbon (hco3(-)) transporter
MGPLTMERAGFRPNSTADKPGWARQAAVRTVPTDPPKPTGSTRLAYRGLLLFMVVYCLRPEDWIPGLAVIPLAKLSGFLAIGGFLASGMSPIRVKGFPKELTYLVLLFVQLGLCIPFAIWRGGSFGVVVFGFSEIVILTVVLALCLDTVKQLRKLIFVQAAGISVVSAVSLIADRVSSGRIEGVIGGIFENPNDLAVGVAMAFPLCFMFLLRARGIARKLLWTVALLAMVRTVLATYSRSGFIALAGAVLVILYEFGIRRKRPQLFAYVGVAIALFVVFTGPANYGERISTILDPNSDPTGSAQQRRELLITSLKITARHPVFGVGPGNFEIASGVWRGSHNTYTQLSAEGGVPALILFLLIFGRSFKNLRSVQKLTKENDEIQMLGIALRASTIAYLVGSFFAHTAYQFYPYFLVGYSTALYLIAKTEPAPVRSLEPIEGRWLGPYRQRQTMPLRNSASRGTR